MQKYLFLLCFFCTENLYMFIDSHKTMSKMYYLIRENLLQISSFT
ncbi:Uncharacterised protein [Streptococcus suis]|uniref:Uncharacterized protein n=1 Tax=Streptococcus suis TaxID=1307 RepID=A0A0Z8MBQ2_STRSU|nr:Uncharacterised protein [Streptococcus suis]CYW07379.1 Uncharacterised protein [Streptococcus suis]